MRNPIDVLKLLTEKASVKEYQFKRLYRNLYNPDFYLLAYKNIATSPGSMTAGSDGMTIDNMSMARINRIISALKDQTYQPNPARRTYIAKKNNPAKKRPLGIPSTDDKLVQEIIRMLLEAIYEPTFSDRSHGFRPKRSCHTALSQIKDTFTGVRWMVEGDIKACFDCFDHHVLIEILRRRIKDEMFLSLMWKFLKAGYMEQWEYHKTYSGTPQGSGMSPILANIYLSELDACMEEYKARFDTEPFKRNASKEYEKIARRYRKAKKKLDAGNPSKEDIQEFKAAQKQKLSTPYADVLDPNFKRIQYNRYADDFVVGVIGSKQDALSIKEDLRQFLAEKLHLTLSEEKTKVTHSSDAVRYLGYDIRVVREKSAKRDKNGALKRPWYGKVFLYVPHEKWENKLHELRVMQVKWDKNRGRDFWRPMHRNELLNSTDIEIIRQYNSEIRGLYNFYRIAENVSVLSKFYYMMRYSMLKTYAGKYRTTVSKIKKKYMRGGVFRVPYITKSGGHSTCSWHRIYELSLKKIVLGEIKAHAEAITLDEDAVLKQLKKQVSSADAARQENTRQEISKLRRRVQELEHLTAKLYEDKVSGTISEATFLMLIEKSEQERIQKADRLDTLLAEANKVQQDMANVQKWTAIVRKHLHLQELDRETLDELIDHIEIGERTIVDGQRHQDIKIFYRFIGAV